MLALAALGGLAAFMMRPPLKECRAASTAETGQTDATEVRGIVTLVRSPAIQTELKLDRLQTAAVEKAVIEIDQPLWQLRDAKDEQSAKRVQKLRKGFQAALDAALRPEQQQRLDQLRWRSKGFWALRDPGFVGRLDLTVSQKDRLSALVMSAESSSSDGKDLDAIEKKALAVLSDPQRGRLKELLGTAFDFSKVKQIAVKAPEIAGIEGWINSHPLTISQLHGKVVVLHFWTFGCINCVHNLPTYKTWHKELPRDEVVMIGVHTPETAEEREFTGLQRAVKERGLEFPVAMDLKGETWKAWGNSIWPCVYVIDRQGYVRYWWTGELNWKGAEGGRWMRQRIEQLIAEKE
jgi:peroxiredoxin